MDRIGTVRDSSAPFRKAARGQKSENAGSRVAELVIGSARRSATVTEVRPASRWWSDTRATTGSVTRAVVSSPVESSGSRRTARRPHRF